MNKRLLLRIATVICMSISVMFAGKDTAFADEVEPAWIKLASMSTTRVSNSEQFQTEVIDGKIYAIGGFNNSVEAYDPTTNTWTTLASMSTTRMNFQTEVVDGKIYAIGGQNNWSTGKNSLSSVEVFDPDTNTWTTLASMSTTRHWFQTEVIDGKIYAIGGRSNEGRIFSAEVYDPTTNTWTTIAPTSTFYDQFQTEVINGKIYVIGSVRAEVYDPATNTWTILASMPTKRSSFQTEVVDGKIYAIGGTNGGLISDILSTTEVYDPATNIWTTMAAMSKTRNYFQTEVVDGKIYAIGGNGDDASTAEVYDPTTNTWTKLTSMSTTRITLQTEVADGRIYAIGGRGLSSVEVYSVTASSEKHLKATAGNSKVDLSWNAVKGATSYTVKRSITAGGPYTTIATGVTGTTYTDTGVTNGTTYYYVVTEVVNGKENKNSNEASATPQDNIDPNQPAGNKALLVVMMVTGEKREYVMTADKIKDFIAWYNSKAASSPTYMIEKDYNKASFTARKDYITYEQISNFEVNEYRE